MRFLELFVKWRKRMHMIELLFQTKETAFTECSTDNTTDNLLTLMLIGCSPYSQMLCNHEEADTKIIAVTM